MRFKQFLEEDNLPKVPSSKSIKMDKAIEWARQHAPRVMERIKDGKLSLVRGVDESKGDYQLGDSTTFKRQSKNTHNYYTIFIATSPKWKEYPSRESAYICASTDRIASGYGDVFYVVPADNARVGKCDSHDIWKSFPVLEKSLGLPGLNSLNQLLMSLMKAIDKEVVPDTEPEKLRETLRGWNMKRLYDLAESNKLNHQNQQSVEDAILTMAKKNIKDFEQLLEYCLDPSINNFTTSVASSADIPSKPGVEAWVEGQALFIREKYFEEFQTQYFL